MSDETLIVVLVAWAISAIVAGLIAQERGRGFGGFALVTFFFLGPLGPGFALLARHPLVERAELLRAKAELSAAGQSQSSKGKGSQGLPKFI